MIFDKFASAVSLVLNPAAIAAFTFLILLWPLQVSQTPLSLLGISFTFGTLIPFVIIYGLSERRIISDFYVSAKEERAKPFAGAIISYVLGSLALVLEGAPSIVTALMLCYVGNTVIMMFITFRWKISVHASAIAGPATVLACAIGMWAAIFFVLLIPIGWARVRLKAHSPWQILAGALVTVVATWIQLRIYFSIL